MHAIQIDHVNRIYVERRPGFTEACDFSTVAATANALAGRLGLPGLSIPSTEVGSAAAYEKYQRLLRLAAGRLGSGEVWYDPRLAPEARQALESARVTRRPVRLHYGDPRTGRDRLAAFDVAGFVGYSGLLLPHPILLVTPKHHLGPRIIELEVVRIVDIHAMVTTFSHPAYHLPALQAVDAPTPAAPLQVLLAADGEPLQVCASKAQATRWIKFYRGEIHQSPPQI